jgi:hypothetical protein
LILLKSSSKYHFDESKPQASKKIFFNIALYTQDLFGGFGILFIDHALASLFSRFQTSSTQCAVQISSHFIIGSVSSSKNFSSKNISASTKIKISQVASLAHKLRAFPGQP